MEWQPEPAQFFLKGQAAQAEFFFSFFKAFSFNQI